MIETQTYIRNERTWTWVRLIDFADSCGQKWVINALSHLPTNSLSRHLLHHGTVKSGENLFYCSRDYQKLSNTNQYILIGCLQ